MPLPAHRKMTGDNEFYCNSCRQIKPNEMKRKRPGGKTPICASCQDKFKATYKKGK